jgi:hypothetical protein
LAATDREAALEAEVFSPRQSVSAVLFGDACRGAAERRGRETLRKARPRPVLLPRLPPCGLPSRPLATVEELRARAPGSVFVAALRDKRVARDSAATDGATDGATARGVPAPRVWAPLDSEAGRAITASGGFCAADRDGVQEGIYVRPVKMPAAQVAARRESQRRARARRRAAAPPSLQPPGPSGPPPSPPPFPSIAVVVMESMSRAAFHAHLPRTSAWLRAASRRTAGEDPERPFDAFVLGGFHSIRRGATAENMTPLFTGQPCVYRRRCHTGVFDVGESGVRDASRRTPRRSSAACSGFRSLPCQNWLWKRLEALGYATAFYGTMRNTVICRDFSHDCKSQIFDHVVHLVGGQDLPSKDSWTPDFQCFGRRRLHERLFEWSEAFFVDETAPDSPPSDRAEGGLYPDLPKFLYAHLDETHEVRAFAQAYDDDESLANHLERLVTRSGAGEHGRGAAVLLLGDHGAEGSETDQRAPFAAILLSRGLLERYPAWRNAFTGGLEAQARRALLQNRQRLVTHLDLHETLRDLATGGMPRLLDGDLPLPGGAADGASCPDGGCPTQGGSRPGREAPAPPLEAFGWAEGVVPPVEPMASVVAKTHPEWFNAECSAPLRQATPRSLLLPIARNRSCADAGLDNAYCACGTAVWRKESDLQSPLVLAVANSFLVMMNHMIKAFIAVAKAKASKEAGTDDKGAARRAGVVHCVPNLHLFRVEAAQMLYAEQRDEDCDAASKREGLCGDLMQLEFSTEEGNLLFRARAVVSVSGSRAVGQGKSPQRHSTLLPQITHVSSITPLHRYAPYERCFELGWLDYDSVLPFCWCNLDALARDKRV